MAPPALLAHTVKHLDGPACGRLEPIFMCVCSPSFPAPCDLFVAASHLLLTVEAAIIGMQEIAFVGYSKLSEAQRALVLAHFMDSSNYAARQKKSKAKVPFTDAGAAAAAPADPSSALALASSARGGGAFIVPRPGVGGAVAGSLEGQTFVLTGVFPEVRPPATPAQRGALCSCPPAACSSAVAPAWIWARRAVPP
jgi:hypothetical protein